MTLCQLVAGIYDFTKNEFRLKKEDPTADKLVFIIFGVILVNNFINFFAFSRFEN